MNNKLIMRIKSKILNDNYFFVRLYIIVSILFLIYKTIMSIIDEDVIEEVIRVNFSNIMFASISNVKFYMFATFESVPFAIILAIHWGMYFSKLIIKSLLDSSRRAFILIILIGIILSLALKWVLRVILPFSLIEGLTLAFIFALFYRIINITEKVENAKKM